MNVARISDCVMMLRDTSLWGNFPRAMRPFWLAQRKRCPYCLEDLPLRSANAHRHGSVRCNWDHVIPKVAGGCRRDTVLAHESCNERKADRMPFACEILFCQITREIANAIYAAKGGHAVV